MFGFIKRIFKKDHNNNKNDLKDESGNILTESSIEYDKFNRRFLKLDNDSCALVIHGDNNVEVIFTKYYDPEHQTITDNEESLMALAVFIKQPGFLEMITDEFKKIASNNVQILTKEDKK